MSEQNTPPFSSLGLSEQVLSSVDYEYPSPIQAESIPPLLAGKDLLGQAQTGTGKTDEMLRMGFVDDVETILKATPEQKQVVLFSATMPPAIKKLTQRYLKDPVDIRIKSKTVTVPTIRQRYWKGKTIHKLDALTRIFEAEPFEGILIFVRTKSMTHELSEKLEARGYATTAINGDIKQELREKTIEQFRRGKAAMERQLRHLTWSFIAWKLAQIMALKRSILLVLLPMNQGLIAPLYAT